MPIFKDSYQTTLGSIVATDKVERALKEALISTSLVNQSLGINPIADYQPIFLLGLNTMEGEVNLFTHPITVSTGTPTKYIISDLRMVTGGSLKNEDAYELSTNKDIESKIRNKTEYRFLRSRAILDAVWQAEGPNRIKNDLPFAGTVFATWLSEVIGKSFALGLGDQHRLTILASIYYQSLFIEGDTFSPEDKERLAVHTIKAANSNSSAVQSVLDMVEGMKDITDFCKYVSIVIESVRLKNFNLTTLLTVVANSWYGVNAKDIIGVSLEHPPTWNAIVYTALNERSYRNSLVARIAERLGKRGNADSYNKSFYEIMRANTSLAMESEELGVELEFNDFE